MISSLPVSGIQLTGSTSPDSTHFQADTVGLAVPTWKGARGTRPPIPKIRKCGVRVRYSLNGGLLITKAGGAAGAGS